MFQTTNQINDDEKKTPPKIQNASAKQKNAPDQLEALQTLRGVFFAVWFFQVYHVQMRNNRYVEQFHVYLSIFLSIYLSIFLSIFLSFFCSFFLSFVLSFFRSFVLSLFRSFIHSVCEIRNKDR